MPEEEETASPYFTQQQIKNNQPHTAMNQHPYYPPSAALPLYIPNSTSLAVILAAFGILTASIVGSLYVAALKSKHALRSIDRYSVAWFALCGFLHVAFEGYYIVHRDNIASRQTLFAQLWKEYALSDSRYLTVDVFTVCVETITVLVWGPLSWFTAISILRNSPHRHICQIIVCTAHLYGVALYYATNWADYRFSGISYSRPEFLYYWVYYIGFNFPWVIVPAVLLYDSWRQCIAAFTALDIQTRQKKD